VVSTFYTPDERGNVAQRLDRTGAVQSSDLYNAYGKRLSGGGASGDPYGFGGQAGYYSDSETGLSLLGERYYDPSVSRFLTRDPYGYPGGMNLYRYAGNNPVNFMDPSGMFWLWHWYMNGMGGFSQWVDDNAMGGSTANFGQVTGEYDSGCASGWDVAGAGAKFGANLAMNAIPGGGEAHAAELVGEDGLRDVAEDLGKGCLERCFVAGTPVQMADGSSKRIVDVQVGDQVKSRDPATGRDEVKTVTATVERHAPVIVDVVLHDTKTDQSETLNCTPEHPLYVQGQGWVEAGSLGIGTSIVSRAGPTLQVTDLTWQKNKAQELARTSGLGGYTVYNLTVDGDHTFFVGNTGGGTWVHNVRGGCGLKFDPNATGTHITHKTDAAGNVTHWAEWEPNPAAAKYPNAQPFSLARRTDMVGGEHAGVDTPHTQFPKGSSPYPGDVRPATPGEESWQPGDPSPSIVPYRM